MSSAAGHPSPCKWAGCTTTCSSDKALYDHLLQRHSAPWRKSKVGPRHRLACEWAGCTTQPSRKWLSVHFTAHSNYRPFACNVSPSCSMRFKTWPVLERHLRRKGYHGASPPLVPGHVLPDLESDPDDGDDLAGENGEDDSYIASEDEGEDADDVPGGLGRTRRAKRPRIGNWTIGDNDEDEDNTPTGSTRNAKRLKVRTAESEDEEAIVEEAVAYEEDDDVPSPAFEPSKSPAVVDPEQENDPFTTTPIKRDFYINLFPERLYADVSSSPSHASFDHPAVVNPEQETDPESADREDEDWNTGMILDAQPTTGDSAAEDPEDWSLV